MKKLRILFFGGTFVNLDISKKCEKLGAKCWLLDRSIDCMAKNNSNFVNQKQGRLLYKISSL